MRAELSFVNPGSLFIGYPVENCKALMLDEESVYYCYFREWELPYGTLGLVTMSRPRAASGIKPPSFGNMAGFLTPDPGCAARTGVGAGMGPHGPRSYDTEYVLQNGVYPGWWPV